MKTPKRNFVVEYRGTRKRPPSQPKSIWGEIDLRSAAKSVEADGLLPTELPPPQTANIAQHGSCPNVVEPLSNASAFHIINEAAETLVSAEETAQEQHSVSSQAHAQEQLEIYEIAPRPRKRRGKDLKPRRRRALVAEMKSAPSKVQADVWWDDELAQLDAENRRLKRELSDKLRGENEALVAMLQRLR